ncbi:unnamed protein product [Prunus armeniaca]
MRASSLASFFFSCSVPSSFKHSVDHVVCSSKRSRQQLQGTSKAISMASKRSSDPDDPTVAPPLLAISFSC